MCKNWKISYAIRGVENDKELREFLLENFPSPKVLNLIKGKIDLITSNPFKYAREKLGRDKYNNPMFSIEVTGNIRILYSVD
ncbi:cytotoxic translational repressor of toxin-antitoxin stability system, partial [Sulfolobus sp. F3]